MTPSSQSRYLVAAVETGGTTCVAALAYSNELGLPFDRLEVPSNSDPRITLTILRRWLRQKIVNDGVTAVGIASFGPIDPNKKSDTYGFITSTPKPGWKNTDVLGMLGLIKRAGASNKTDNNSNADLDCACDGEFDHVPFLFDTDVNAPAFAEFVHLRNTGVSQISSSAYITVGTGVGAGLVVNGGTISGLLHPEAGHILVQRKAGDTYEGCCPFHRCCLEGMVCSRALSEKAGLYITDPTKGIIGAWDQTLLPQLSDEHPIWDETAFYLAQLCASLILITSVERIVLGGGIFNRDILYEKIRGYLKIQLNGYIQHSAVTTDEGLRELVTPSIWGSQAGLVGALFLASEAYTSKHV